MQLGKRQAEPQMAASCYNNKSGEPCSYLSLPSSPALACFQPAGTFTVYHCHTEAGFVSHLGFNIPIMKWPDFVQSYEYDLSLSTTGRFCLKNNPWGVSGQNNNAEASIYLTFYLTFSLLLSELFISASRFFFVLVSVRVEAAVLHPDSSVEVQ